MYNKLWDIYIDWGLLRKNDKYYLLREKISFPRIVYNFAMIYDVFIKASWIWYFILLRSSLLEWKSLFSDTLEVIRRGLCTLIRIENENVTNSEYYRSFLIIPDIPMTDGWWLRVNPHPWSAEPKATFPESWYTFFF